MEDKDVKTRPKVVVAAGGGTVIAPGVVGHLAGKAFVVALVAPRDLRLERMRNDAITRRPLAAGAASDVDDAKARELPREGLLATVADATVEASGAVGDVVAAVRRVAWSGRALGPIHSP